jgi:xanthine dehydrogenase accessory factor
VTKERFFARVAELLRTGHRFAVARLLEVEGSVPQHVGAAMIVFEDGRIEGTIGGGRFEASVILDAMKLLEQGLAVKVETYSLTRDDLMMYCAGRAEVILEAFSGGRDLLIFGGGHVGQALSRLAPGVGGFRVVVIDDRAEFAQAAAHPRAHRVIHTDPLYDRDLPELNERTYAVIVTRCHDVDKKLLRKLAPLKLAYLGMIGSKSKAKSLLRELEDEGISREQLDRVRTPIGLPLGVTKEPGEIALAILAEVVQAKNTAEA